jgi:hypothetical protein
MADNKPQPTERTPLDLEVPVPKRDEFFGNLRKVAEPDKPVPMEDDPEPPQGDPLNPYGENWSERS